MMGIQRRTRSQTAPWLIAAALAWASALGCGSDDARDEAMASSPDLDAAVQSAPMAKPTTPRPPPPNIVGLDAGDSEPFFARLQTNGSSPECGSCAVLVTHASGGKQPYTYAWSDPTLQGPGPHKVCPTGPTTYAVTVSDDSATAGEFAKPAASEHLTTELSCTPGTDAGTGYLTGCTLAEELPTVECPRTAEADWFNVSTSLPEPLQAGKSYQLTYDQLLLTLGEPVTVDVYGSAEQSCDTGELLGTLTLDGRWHQGICFTPKVDYRAIIIRIHVGFTLFYFDLVKAIATVCSECDESSASDVQPGAATDIAVSPMR
jgi:hypothetical protein